MKIAILLCCVGVSLSQIPVPDGAILGVRNAGIATIGAQISAINKELTEAVLAFKPINDACNAKLEKSIESCGTCVQSKCKARAESVCKPEEWQRILGQTISFFKDGIPGFFSGTIPDVFVNKIGGGVVDVSKDIAGFFTNQIGGGITDAGKTIGGGVVDVGKKIGGGIVDGANSVIDFGKGIGEGVADFGKKVASGVIDFGNTIKGGFNTALDGLKDLGSKIGKIGGKIGGVFGDIFGKREITYEEFVRTRRAGEPGCSDFENDPEKACKFYLTPSYCPKCSFDPKTECAGYKAATDRINTANTTRQWLTKATNQNYNIKTMSFNPAAMDPATGAFIGVKVSVHIFGKDFDFAVNKPINPYIPTTAGPAIAAQALEKFKNSA